MITSNIIPRAQVADRLAAADIPLAGHMAVVEVVEVVEVAFLRVQRPLAGVDHSMMSAKPLLSVSPPLAERQR